MKVLIDHSRFGGGPCVFRSRIAQGLQGIDGVSVTKNPKDKFDVELSIIRFLNRHKRPNVLRIDGVYYRPDVLRKNNEIKTSIRRASHVIYQSKFSFRMCCKILGIGGTHPHSIIHNGIDTDYIRKVHADSNIPPGSFVAVAEWRDNKRPNSIMSGFLEANTGRDLYMIGPNLKVPKSLKHSSIHVMGKMKTPQIISTMKACQYQMHLCHIDSCPNAVIEGLACGLNVLCTNLGGTRELVKDNGFVLDVDKWNFKPNKFDKIDKMNSRDIADGIHHLMNIETRADRPDLDMSLTSRKYCDVMKGLV
jgi:glycosyltransferase involved in cell wall biosynthesis